MQKRNFLFIVLVIFANTLFAHEAEDSLVVFNTQTGKNEVFDLPTGMADNYEKLLQEWHARNYLSLSNDCQTSNEIPVFPDSVYADRLARIPAVMELPYNSIVRGFIDAYAVKQRSKVAYMLGAMNFYMPIFEEALDLYNVPNELKYLPVIESALNPSAVSRAGAAGLWQFMLKTGKIYGLVSNSLVDERRDPIKSTFAAARYLSELYKIYNDWTLVIAAYNCGPGNVNKAIRRANGSTDYWTIYNYLPRETRGYVPAFIAANYIMNYYCEHNICPMNTELPAGSDTIVLHRDVHFKQISELCGVSLEQLHSLNPQYKTELVPGYSLECTLRLPAEAIASFIDLGDSLYAYKANELLSRRKYVSVKGGSVNAVYHKIRNGETLSTIARKYGVSVNNLKKWNNLKNSRIRAGKRLRVSP